MPIGFAVRVLLEQLGEIALNEELVGRQCLSCASRMHGETIQRSAGRVNISGGSARQMAYAADA